MFSPQLRYFLYGTVLSASLISLSVQATGTDGVFGDYFTNMITDSATCGSDKVITGFDPTPGDTYGKQRCTTFQNIVATVLGSAAGGYTAPVGQAVIGFSSTGMALYGVVSDNTWQKNGSDISYTGGNIGIGTTTPSPGAKLEVNGQVKITGGTPAAGKVLTSDLNGLASWTTPVAGGQACHGIGDDYNTCYGTNALVSNTYGAFNTANGVSALTSNTNGSANTANGTFALYLNTNGSANTANGQSALFANIIGADNTANGVNALTLNTTGDSNTANGSNALRSNTTGGYNTANGYLALNYNTTAYQNTAMGYYAGGDITTGSFNIAIGAGAQVALPTANYQLSIGNWIYGTNGNIGIGTNAPTVKLDVVGDIKTNTKITTPQLCLSGVCKTVWPTGGAGASGIVTGPLTWSAEYGAMTYDQAWSTCLGLAPAGQWRVPSTSDIDLGRHINAGLFTGLRWYWSSTSANDGHTWTMLMKWGPVHNYWTMVYYGTSIGSIDTYGAAPMELRCVSNS